MNDDESLPEWISDPEATNLSVLTSSPPFNLSE
jgi:hypothetical protein